MCVCLGLAFIFVCFFLVQLLLFVLVLFAFVVLGLVFFPRQEIGWEERHRNDLFCVECDVKP